MLKLQIANAITPNNDGVNEFFIIPELKLDLAAYPDNKLIIFNRWGEIVFESAPYANQWNGVNSANEDLPEGTYYYIMQLM